MVHFTPSAKSQVPASTVVWTVATTMLCHSVALGTSSAIAQPTSIPTADPVSNSNGLDFGLSSIDSSAEVTGSMAMPDASFPFVRTSPLPSAPSDSLSFELTPVPSSTSAPPSLSPPIASEGLSPSLADLFVGDTHSLVAIAIGGAEGTRTPDGGKTWAFKGHTDPGNGVWNLGTFSWQHGANSPEEADRKQLARLSKQAVTLNKQAIARGVPWGLVEQLNALDLANQSPSAALDPGGYMDRLKQAHDDGLRGTEAILWARTWSYRHPSGTRWNAPGLGNTHHGIRTDQKRRMDAIDKAIAAYSSPTITPSPTEPSLPVEPRSASIPPTYVAPEVSVSQPQSLLQQRLQQKLREDAIVDQVLTVDV